jgi:hypothetical protein
MAWTVTNILAYSNFAVNFYIYTATNTRVRHELKMLIVALFNR